jgi:hypothetical protein
MVANPEIRSIGRPTTEPNAISVDSCRHNGCLPEGYSCRDLPTRSPRQRQSWFLHW